MSAEQVMEQKGLDIVRRDWCPLSKDVGNFALRAILSGEPREVVVNAIHEHLADVKDKVGDEAQQSIAQHRYSMQQRTRKRRHSIAYHEGGGGSGTAPAVEFTKHGCLLW